MEEENWSNGSIIHEKSMNFAVRMVHLYQFLCEEKKEFVLSKQLLKSGTSIGANVQEALCGCTKKDFLNKMYIAYKECNETKYWIELLHRTEYLSKIEYESIENDCIELLKMLTSITKTTKQNLKVLSI